MRAAILAMLVVIGVFEGVAAADSLLVGKVTDLLGQPVSKVRVHVLTPGDHQIVTTNDAGEYKVVVDGNKQISVVIGAGSFHTFRGGQIKDGATIHLNFELEVSDGEIIRIIDSKPPAVLPKLPGGAPRVTPPYSTEAMERDAWAKAWLLLDVDETGRVRRVKLVKRPGFDLDNIAVAEAMKLKFEPALDENNKPMRTSIFWAMEWPSYAWLMSHQGSTQRMPVESYAIDPFRGNFAAAYEPTNDERGVIVQQTGDASLATVPCAGSGPLNLDRYEHVYRDCSRPNEYKVPHLPWLDGTAPVPPDPPSIAAQPEPVLHLTRASYVPQIASSAVSLALWTATAISFYKFDKYLTRMAHYNLIGPGQTPRDDLVSTARLRDRWGKWSLVILSAAAASTGLSMSLWFRHQRHAEFSVQPEAGGASASVSGSF